MTGQIAIVATVIAMVVVIVGVDVLLFRDHPWERVASNVGIVLLLGASFVRYWGV